MKVKIFEHIIHSAMMHHLAATFHRQFKEECSLEQAYRMCQPNAQLVRNESGLFAQPVHVIHWLLSSDILKVSDENTVLSFIFHYVNLQHERGASKQD